MPSVACRRWNDFGLRDWLTDLVKDVAQSHDRGLDFAKSKVMAQKLIEAAPEWVAFNGLESGRAAAVKLELSTRKRVRVGAQL